MWALDVVRELRPHPSRLLLLLLLLRLLLVWVWLLLLLLGHRLPPIPPLLSFPLLLTFLLLLNRLLLGLLLGLSLPLLLTLTLLPRPLRPLLPLLHLPLFALPSPLLLFSGLPRLPRRTPSERVVHVFGFFCFCYGREGGGVSASYRRSSVPVKGREGGRYAPLARSL
jgi:hypothetical protein